MRWSGRIGWNDELKTDVTRRLQAIVQEKRRKDNRVFEAVAMHARDGLERWIAIC